MNLQQAAQANSATEEKRGQLKTQEESYEAQARTNASEATRSFLQSFAPFMTPHVTNKEKFEMELPI